MSRKLIGLVLVCVMFAPLALAQEPAASALSWLDWMSRFWATWLPVAPSSNSHAEIEGDGSPSIDPIGLEAPEPCCASALAEAKAEVNSSELAGD